MLGVVGVGTVLDERPSLRVVGVAWRHSDLGLDQIDVLLFEISGCSDRLMRRRIQQ